jgi:hypothetical protein
VRIKVISPREFPPASTNPKGLSADLYFSTKSSGNLKEKKSDICGSTNLSKWDRN